MKKLRFTGSQIIDALKRAKTNLIARSVASDAHAFEAIMRRHNRLLFRTARSIVRNVQRRKTYFKTFICAPGAS